MTSQVSFDRAIVELSIRQIELLEAAGIPIQDDMKMVLEALYWILDNGIESKFVRWKYGNGASLREIGKNNAWVFQFIQREKHDFKKI